VWVVVLLEAVCVLLSRVRKPAGRDDHPAFGAVEVEGRYGGVELLDDGASDRPRVLTLDDDRTPRSVDDLLHKDIATLVSRAVGLADVLVAEVTEHVLDHILELEPREIVQYSHSELCGQYVATVKYVAERSLVLF